MPKTLSRKQITRLGPVFDALVAQYKTPAYIENDPIQLPYRYADDPKTCEMVALITALFSYGRREAIIETMRRVFRIMGDSPLDFVQNFSPKRDGKLFSHFLYRFNKPGDLVFLLSRLQWVYQHYESLEDLFLAQQLGTTPDLKTGIAGFTDVLLNHQPPATYGLKFLLAHPTNGGACKRFNMFLRWMVRQDPEPAGRVDFGLWQRALSPKGLLVPLDTHILKMNAQLRLSTRKSSDWQTAEEITEIFRAMCPEDPVKYDYALFGFSMDRRPIREILEQTPPLPATPKTAQPVPAGL